MKTLLITRPPEDAGEVAFALERSGFRTFLEPMLHITPFPEHQAALDAALARAPQLLLVTSRSAIRLLAGMTPRRDIPLLPVGESTAKFASSLGFVVPEMSCENAGQLMAHVAKHYKAARILHARGENITIDMEAALSAKGFKTDSVILYRATPAEALSDNFVREMQLGHIAGALFFSKRTAETYVKLVGEHKLAHAHHGMDAVAISDTVAGTLRQIPWQSLHTAASPDMEHMVQKSAEIF